AGAAAAGAGAPHRGNAGALPAQSRGLGAGRAGRRAGRRGYRPGRPQELHFVYDRGGGRMSGRWHPAYKRIVLERGFETHRTHFFSAMMDASLAHVLQLVRQGIIRPQDGRQVAAALLKYAFLVLAVVPMLFPFIWMVLTSLKPFGEVFSLDLLPSRPTLDNYVALFSRTMFPRWFFNSLLVGGLTVASVLFFDSLVGYTLAKLPFPGKNVVFVLILSTMFVPTEMLVLPWYQMSADYGWLDTYWGILFPGIMTAFGVFLMRQAFSTLPDELLDAGRIDGLSEFGLYWRIALPLVKPSLAALAILTFIGNWNAYLWPLIVAESRQMYTLPVGLSLFSGEVGAQWNMITAGSAVAVIPMMIVFAIFQRQIIEGVVRSGLK